ncbi:MAG: hypothetical protein ABF946_10065 [Acetobacter papayae]
MQERSNIRVLNQDARILEMVKQLRHHADNFGQAAFSCRAELFIPAANALDAIAACMRDQADKMALSLRRPIVANDAPGIADATGPWSMSDAPVPDYSDQ